MAYCRYCGKQIPDGTICSCQQQQIPPTQQVSEQTTQQAQETQQTQQVQETVVQTEQQASNSNYDPYAKAAANSQAVDIGVVQDKMGDFFQKVGVETKEENISIYEKNKLIVPDCISAYDGEIPIKQYKFARLRTPLLLARAEGRLQITNKRVLFRATGRNAVGRTTVHEEFEISELAGVEFRKGHDHYSYQKYRK